VKEVPAVLAEVSEHPFLHGLNQRHLEALAECAMRARFNAGDVIFREGDPANRFYLIIKGKVVVESQTEHKRTLLQTVGAGDVLGWSWLFPPYYLHFDARAIEPTEVMFFYGTRLREMCEEDRDLGFEMLKRIAHVVINRLVTTEKRLLGHIHA